MCGRCYISHIGEVLLSISSAYHIHLLCKMHFESCAISHDYQSKRYENDNYLLGKRRLCLCEQHYSKRYEQIAMKFYRGVRGGTKN